jgi:hypothetical protein
MPSTSTSTCFSFLLCDPGLRFVWCGPGMRRLDSVDLLRVPRWDKRIDANRAARALCRAIGLIVQPEPLSLSKR